ncbi:hypothetical protein RJ640_017248 [Escallonia rubra]|uniref:Uncharacterized protein n=1 Tax=Escallonia rubra TaxID=112253 RepID=A0AA88UMH3_9ASTE|nr:hypothetical protein RJ640_017248 [Escallonia rubra]
MEDCYELKREEEEGEESNQSNYTSEEEGSEEYRRGGYHAVRTGDSFKGGHISDILLLLLGVQARSLVPLYSKQGKYFSDPNV